MAVRLKALRRVYAPWNRKEHEVGHEFDAPTQADADRLVRRKRVEIVGGGKNLTGPSSEDSRGPAADDVASLRTEYETTLGRRPFMGWDAAQLKDKINTYRRRDMVAE